MIRLSPKRTALLRQIRHTLTIPLVCYGYSAEKIEAMVTKEMTSICKLSNSKVRRIARAL